MPEYPSWIPEVFPSGFPDGIHQAILDFEMEVHEHGDDDFCQSQDDTT